MRHIILSIFLIIILGLERRLQIPLSWVLLLIVFRRRSHVWILVAIATLIVDLTLMFPLGVSAVCMAVYSFLLDFTPNRWWSRLLWLECLFGSLVGVYALNAGYVSWQMIIAGIIAGFWYGLWKSEPDSVEIGNA